MNLPGGWELVLVVIVIMVLFGAKRLPEASRSLGRSMRIFKAETKGLRDDDASDTDTGRGTEQPTAPIAAAPIAAAPMTPTPITPPSVTPPSVVPPGSAPEQSPQRQP